MSKSEMGTEFVAVFGEVACFECLIAESHLGMQGYWWCLEDLGDREPGERWLAKIFFTDEAIRLLMQNERLYVSRDDQRLGLNENHIIYVLPWNCYFL